MSSLLCSRYPNERRRRPWLSSPLDTVCDFVLFALTDSTVSNDYFQSFPRFIVGLRAIFSSSITGNTCALSDSMSKKSQRRRRNQWRYILSSTHIIQLLIYAILILVHDNVMINSRRYIHAMMNYDLKKNIMFLSPVQVLVHILTITIFLKYIQGRCGVWISRFLLSRRCQKENNSDSLLVSFGLARPSRLPDVAESFWRFYKCSKWLFWKRRGWQRRRKSKRKQWTLVNGAQSPFYWLNLALFQTALLFSCHLCYW